MYTMTDEDRIDAAKEGLESAKEEMKRGFYSASEGILRRVLDDTSGIREEKYLPEKKSIEDIANKYLEYSIEMDSAS